MHNLFYYQTLMHELREAIDAGRLTERAAQFRAGRERAAAAAD